MFTEKNSSFGVGDKSLSFLTGNQDFDKHKNQKFAPQKKFSETQNDKGLNIGSSNIFRNNSTKTVEVKIEPGCESSPYSEDVTLLSKSESENPVQEDVSKRVWRKFAKRFHKIYGLDKKRSEKEAIELELLVRGSFKEPQLYKDMIVKIIKMIDNHKRRIYDNSEESNFSEKHKKELLVLFNQEKKRAECLDEMSSEKNHEMLEENILMSDNEKQISFDNDFGSCKVSKKGIEFDLGNAAEILNPYQTQKEREKQDEEKLLDEIIQTNELS